MVISIILTCAVLRPDQRTKDIPPAPFSAHAAHPQGGVDSKIKIHLALLANYPLRKYFFLPEVLLTINVLVAENITFVSHQLPYSFPIYAHCFFTGPDKRLFMARSIHVRNTLSFTFNTLMPLAR